MTRTEHEMAVEEIAAISDPLVRATAERIEAGIEAWRSGRMTSPDDRDHVIAGCEAMGLDWHDHETIVEGIAETIYLDAGEEITTLSALAEFVVEQLRALTIPVGTRVRLVCDVERYPHFIAPKGATGTVVTNADEESGGVFAVRLDEPLAGAEEWSNEVHWFDGILGYVGRDIETIDETTERSGGDA